MRRATTPTGQLALGGDVGPITLNAVRTDGVPALGILSVGLQWFAANVNVPQPAFDLWIDDVLIDDAPLTCAE